MRSSLIILIFSSLLFSSNVFALSFLGTWTTSPSLAGNTITIEQVGNRLVSTISRPAGRPTPAPTIKCEGTPNGSSSYKFCGKTYTIGDVDGTTWLFSGRNFYKQNWQEKDNSLWYYMPQENVIFFKKDKSAIAKKFQTTIQKFSNVCKVFKRLGIYLTIYQDGEYLKSKLALSNQRHKAVESEISKNGLGYNKMKERQLLLRVNRIKVDDGWDKTYLIKIGFYSNAR